jgi:hypothetical protein
LVHGLKFVRVRVMHEHDEVWRVGDRVTVYGFDRFGKTRVLAYDRIVESLTPTGMPRVDGRAYRQNGVCVSGHSQRIRRPTEDDAVNAPLRAQAQSLAASLLARGWSIVGPHERFRDNLQRDVVPDRLMRDVLVALARVVAPDLVPDEST